MQLGLVLSTAVNAIAPIVLLILFGYWLRSKGFLSPEFVKMGSNFAIIGLSLATTPGGDEQLATQLVVWTSLGAVVTIFLQVCILIATGFLVV